VDVWRVMCLESSNYLLFSLRDCFVCLFLNTLLKIERGGETLLPIYPMGHKQSVILRLNTTPHSTTHGLCSQPYTKSTST
jgi:hypothetical protein